jgi:hypothetical protein
VTKIGRNELCPCGSGKKYKKCHGSFTAEPDPMLPPGLDEAWRENLRKVEARRVQRQKQQGLGRGIISCECADYRMVAVANTVHWSKEWRTFQDFLRDFLIMRLGRDWFAAEMAKPVAQRHRIAQWYDLSIYHHKQFGKPIGKILTAPMTGAQRAYLNLAYNVYLIAHHAEAADATLLDTILSRLKSERSDDFIGKLFETYAAAAFLKAAFHLAYENETDGNTSHVEFVATYPKTGNKFSVEVKARNRSPQQEGPVDDIKRLRVRSKLNRSLGKEAKFARVVMIEVNIPDVLTEVTKLDGWPQAALRQIRAAEQFQPPNGGEKPSAYVFVTNHAFHNNLDAVGAGTQVLAAGCGIADFGPDIPFGRLKDVLETEKRHVEMFALIDSMRTHFEIPVTFDGEIPEFAFRDDEFAPLKFGQWYIVPGPDGVEVEARLYEASVLENEKCIYGVYEGRDGKHFIATTPMTDNELIAWERHPETFFGEVRQSTGQVNNWLELAKFMYQTYQHTAREKLLDWMKQAPDFEELAKLPQSELAIIYCERCAWSTEQKNS